MQVLFEPREEILSSETVIKSFKPQAATNVHDQLTIREARRIARARIQERTLIRVRQLLGIRN